MCIANVNVTPQVARQILIGMVMRARAGEFANGVIERLFGDEGVSDLVPRSFWIAFGGIALLGAILRFWNLPSAPIWMDEAVTLAMAELPISMILFNTVDNHPPLTFAIQHYWQMLFPDPAYARVPAATVGSLTVIAIMLAARDLLSPRAALFAGLFFAVATGHIYYSQEARMYSYLIFGLVLAAWGGMGHVRPNLHSPRAYSLLYIIGGGVAIYSHMLGLVVMGLIGFASLGAGLIQHDPKQFLREWFIRNIILFAITLLWLVQIPSAVGTFPGLSGDNALLDIQWYYRNITGFPGLEKISILFEGLFYLAAGLSILLAWRANRRGLAVMLGCLIVLFPLVVLGLHIRQPLLANKVLLPGIIGVTLGAAYTFSRLRSDWMGLALAGIIGLAGLASSVTELRHHIKAEDYPGAFAYVDANGFAQAPILTCNHFATAAAWEARPSARFLQYRGGDIIHYQGREYWQAAARSMSWLRAASATDIDQELGGGWMIDGGLEAAFSAQPKLAFMRPNCPGDQEQDILNQISDLGYVVQDETLIRGGSADFQILDVPLTRVTLFAQPQD